MLILKNKNKDEVDLVVRSSKHITEIKTKDGHFIGKYKETGFFDTEFSNSTLLLLKNSYGFDNINLSTPEKSTKYIHKFLRICTDVYNEGESLNVGELLKQIEEHKKIEEGKTNE